jgi:hypothetical protein
LNIVVPRTKIGSKQPSDAEVDLAKLVKLTKKSAPSLAVVLAVACVSIRASVSKGAASDVKKTVTLAQKHRVPASRMVAEASSVESHESSPHDPLPEAVSRLEHEALL